MEAARPVGDGVDGDVDGRSREAGSSPLPFEHDTEELYTFRHKNTTRTHIIHTKTNGEKTDGAWLRRRKQGGFRENEAAQRRGKESNKTSHERNKSNTIVRTATTTTVQYVRVF